MTRLLQSHLPQDPDLTTACLPVPAPALLSLTPPGKPSGASQTGSRISVPADASLDQDPAIREELAPNQGTPSTGESVPASGRVSGDRTGTPSPESHRRRRQQRRTTRNIVVALLSLFALATDRFLAAHIFMREVRCDSRTAPGDNGEGCKSSAACSRQGNSGADPQSGRYDLGPTYIPR